MDKEIDIITQQHKLQQQKIKKLSEALKPICNGPSPSVSCQNPNGDIKKVDSIFSLGKISYLVTTNDKNSMNFTSIEDVKNYLDK